MEIFKAEEPNNEIENISDEVRDRNWAHQNFNKIFTIFLFSNFLII